MSNMYLDKLSSLTMFYTFTGQQACMYCFMVCELPATGSGVVLGLYKVVILRWLQACTLHLNVPQACYKHSQNL